MKNKKIIRAEIIVMIILLSVLLLPRLIGTTQVEVSEGYISEIETLNGHVIGVTNKREEQELAKEYMPDSMQIEYQTLEEGIKAIKDNDIDALVCDFLDATNAMNSDDDLIIYHHSLPRKDATDVDKEDLYYLVVRKEDCAYNITTKTLEDVYKPGIRIACLTGLDEANRLKAINPDCIIEYYDNFVDCYSALANNKVDFCFSYDDNIKDVLLSFKNIAAIPEPFYLIKERFALSNQKKATI